MSSYPFLLARAQCVVWVLDRELYLLAPMFQRARDYFSPRDQPAASILDPETQSETQDNSGNIGGSEDPGHIEPVPFTGDLASTYQVAPGSGAQSSSPHTHFIFIRPFI